MWNNKIHVITQYSAVDYRLVVFCTGQLQTVMDPQHFTQPLAVKLARPWLT